MSRQDAVTARQAQDAQTDTSRSRAGYAAGRGTRSISSARTTVQTTAGGSQPIQPGPRRY